MRFQVSLSRLARLLYLAIVLLITFLLLVSVVFLLSQVVRTSPNQVWTYNVNALVISGSYILIFVASVLLCIKRRLSVRRSLAHIPKGRIAVSKGDMPRAVHVFVEEELLRACAIAYAARPKVDARDGWGVPGSKFEGQRLRTFLWDEVPKVDSAARSVIPSIPALSPHANATRHFRHIKPLIPIGADGRDHLKIFTEAVEKSKRFEVELTQEEFDRAMESSDVIQNILTAYQKALNDIPHAQKLLLNR